ncbi:MAG: ShlB/FhaC/HecB family hemolysin secretion/activation protein [Roseobacter sp.]|nr:ShlB/FhaC/HecB family hemolysin secretion/activation protein [Roseobacter sp.]
MNLKYLSSACFLSAIIPIVVLAQAPELPPLPPADVNDARQVEAPEPTLRAGPVTVRGSGGSFTLNGIVLEGATALDRETLEPIWSDLIGTGVTVETLDAVAREISAAYRAEGFVLSQAILPAQTVDGGIVRILVVEGVIDEIRLSGGAANQQKLVSEYFGQVRSERPLALPTLERSVLLSREAVGGVDTVLGPSPDTFGAADLEVLLTPQPLTGYVSLDNLGSRLYGDWTLGTGVRSYNMLGANEVVDVSFALAPQDTSLVFGGVVAEVPLAGVAGTRLDGARLQFDASVFRGDPDLAEAGADSDLTSVADQVELGVGIEVPVLRTRSENLFVRFGLTWRDSETESGLPGLRTIDEDRLAILEAGVEWDYADRIGGISLVDVSVRQGLDTLGARQAATGPAAGDVEFTSAQFSLSRLQALGDGNWSMFGEVVGQVASGVQPNSERFYLGGASIGRGFAPGNTSGDTGYGLRAELRRAINPEILGRAADAAGLFAFVDYGRARDKTGARDGEVTEELSSIGIGAQIAVNDWLSLTPQLVRQISGTPNDTRDSSRETRVLLSAVARF